MTLNVLTGSGSIPTTRGVSPTSSSDWIRHGHDIEEAIADRLSKTRANSDYIFKSSFETMREIQDFEWGNISMSRSKPPDPPLTRPTEFPEYFTILPLQNGKAHKPMPEHFTMSTEQNVKGHVPDDRDPDP